MANTGIPALKDRHMHIFIHPHTQTHACTHEHTHREADLQVVPKYLPIQSFSKTEKEYSQWSPFSGAFKVRILYGNIIPTYILALLSTV